MFQIVKIIFASIHSEETVIASWYFRTTLKSFLLPNHTTLWVYTKVIVHATISCDLLY